MAKLAKVKLENFRQYAPQGTCGICGRQDTPVVVAGLKDNGTATCKECAQGIVTLHDNMAIMFGSENVE